MGWVPTLYKARGVPVKQQVCGICLDRTRGRTSRLDLGYGVSVWLCEAHADPAFVRRRSGRDLVVTLQRAWSAYGCLTAARSKALDAHLRALRGAAAGTKARPRPGSYAWPELRLEAERRFAAGAALTAVASDLRKRLATTPASPPSLTTVARWRAERRWLAAPQPP